MLAYLLLNGKYFWNQKRKICERLIRFQSVRTICRFYSSPETHQWQPQILLDTPSPESDMSESLSIPKGDEPPHHLQAKLEYWRKNSREWVPADASAQAGKWCISWKVCIRLESGAYVDCLRWSHLKLVRMTLLALVALLKLYFSKPVPPSNDELASSLGMSGHSNTSFSQVTTTLWNHEVLCWHDRQSSRRLSGVVEADATSLRKWRDERGKN